MSEKPGLSQPDLSQPKTPAQYLRLYLSGFAMGSADIVPGVSGGTMAFILGVYETLIDAIKSFDVQVIRMALRFDIRSVLEHVPVRFLIALLLGIGSAVLLLANILHHLLENEPTFIFAFFAGLIIASILAIGVKIRLTMPALLALVIATVFAFVIVGIEGESADPVEDLVIAVRTGDGVIEAEAALVKALEDANAQDIQARIDALKSAVAAGDETTEIEQSLNSDTYVKSAIPVLFFSGMIAICAMLLPGISGSFILLILGQYAAALGAVKNFDIVSIAALGAGAIIGVVVFSRVISWMLKHHANVTIAALVGFMTGSLRLIWLEAEKGISVVNPSGSLDAGQWVLVAVLLVGGFLLVSLLDHLQSRTNPVFAPFWPGRPVDDITHKAESLE